MQIGQRIKVIDQEIYGKIVCLYPTEVVIKDEAAETTDDHLCFKISEVEEIGEKNKREDKIKFIIEQEKAANNSWKWIKTADDKTINELYEYWTQEL